MTYENQKTIKIQKEKSNKNNLYAIFNLEALQFAMNDLKGESFKLWCYLNKNQNGYTFGLSAADAMTWGVGSRSSYNRAVKELTDKGYLVQKEGNNFDFFEYPKPPEITVTVNNSFDTPTIEKMKTFIDEDTDENGGFVF